MPDDRTSTTIWRERIQLTQTVKDGWRVGEVTVEVTYQEGEDQPSQRDKQRQLINAIESGQQVADRQNKIRNATLSH